jgi:hypothetical protein
MAKLTPKELKKWEANRDLAAELERSVREMKAGKATSATGYAPLFNSTSSLILRGMLTRVPLAAVRKATTDNLTFL